MSTSQPALSITTESITPAKATKYLGQNINNRTLRSRRVRVYAEQMTRDQWQMIGDPIRFDTTGRLIDGQHRLHAVILSGKTVPFVVIRNLEPESFVAIDSGLNRQPSDVLGHDVAAGSHKAAAIRVMYVVEAGGDPRKTEDNNAVTRQDVHEYYNNNRVEVEEATNLGAKVYSHIRGNRSAWSALALFTRRIDPALSDQFFDGLITGAGMTNGDPRLALRNWLANPINYKKVGLAGGHLAIYIRIWNDFMNGVDRQLIRLTPGGGDPFPAFATKKKGQP